MVPTHTICIGVLRPPQGYLNDATRVFSYFLPVDAIMFPLSEYVIKLIPSLVTFHSKKGKTLAQFT